MAAPDQATGTACPAWAAGDPQPLPSSGDKTLPSSCQAAHRCRNPAECGRPLPPHPTFLEEYKELFCFDGQPASLPARNESLLFSIPALPSSSSVGTSNKGPPGEACGPRRKLPALSFPSPQPRCLLLVGADHRRQITTQAARGSPGSTGLFWHPQAAIFMEQNRIQWSTEKEPIWKDFDICGHRVDSYFFQISIIYVTPHFH